MSATPNRLPAPEPFELWLVSLAAEPSRDDGLLLDDVERERAARFVFERDRRRYVAAHAALRRLLGRRTGHAPGSLRFERGPFGKPRLSGEPRCSFSLSHSGDHALIALADDGDIGVDVEELRPLQDLDGLKRQCLTEGEYLRFDATPPAERELAFLRLWTRKEAGLKALGIGLQVEPSTFEAGFGTSEQQVWIDSSEGMREVVVHSLEPMPGLVAALAWAVGRPKRGMPEGNSNLYSGR